MAEMSETGPTREQDAGKIATALGLLSSCVKSGDDWSEHCELAKNEAFDALSRLASLPPQAGRAGEREAIYEECAQIVENNGTGAHQSCTKAPKDCLFQIAADIRERAAASPPPSPLAKGWRPIETAQKWLAKTFAPKNIWLNPTAMRAYTEISDLLRAKPSLPAPPLVADTLNIHEGGGK